MALWGYSDHVFPGHPKASQLVHQTAYGKDADLLGPYWQEPGRSIVQNYLRDIKPPPNQWDTQRSENVPEQGQSGTGDCLTLRKRMSIESNMRYIRTWSSYHGWKEKHPGSRPRADGGSGDVIDSLFDEIQIAEPDWGSQTDWLQQEIDVEWGTALILARRKED